MFLSFLLNFLLILQTQSDAHSTVDTFILEPESSVQTIDGLIVDAGRAGLDEAITITVERLSEEQIAAFDPPRGALEAITSYYQISSTEYVWTGGKTLVHIPLPEGFTVDKLLTGGYLTAESLNAYATHGPFTKGSWITFKAKESLPGMVAVSIGVAIAPGNMGVVIMLLEEKQ